MNKERFQCYTSTPELSESLEQQILPLYLKVRDIPFGTPPPSSLSWKESIIKFQKGGCTDKHYLLGEWLEKYNLTVKYLTFPFYWQELPANYPPSLEKLSKKMPLQYHLCISLSFHDHSCLLDATWDPDLEKAHLPINKPCQNIQQTKLAIVPHDQPIVHHSINQRQIFIQELKKNMPYVGIESDFYQQLDSWFDSLR